MQGLLVAGVPHIVGSSHVRRSPPPSSSLVAIPPIPSPTPDLAASAALHPRRRRI
ncbi:hypothetical protein AXF42_Ash015190 [Apostasia shenzhenica]|uniref:Uncharacterized protein n=1 Tax=Apostasia shenzhenica TaxID=1088818 RepID=A0A2I0AQI8_9ASPA|nr:hypothetical protein AXF42_Ash015190 [Apostasia shenzhenica]